MPQTNNTDRIGINAVEAIFLRMGWVFREQTVSDYGIDAQVEVVENGVLTGKLIALQIKTGNSYFKKKGAGFIFYGKQRHLDYWENHSLPVFLILYNPDSKIALWQKIQRSDVILGRKLAWSIEIPKTNVLDEKASKFIAAGIASDPEAIRRFNLSFDATLIEEFAKKESIFFTIPQWLNKTLSFRSVQIYFGDPHKEVPDLEIDRWLPTNDIGMYMSRCFPWLDFDYTGPIKEHWGEIGEHFLEVQINKIGRAFLVLEEFYREGIEDFVTPIPPEPTADDMDEYEWEEYKLQRALEQDWQDEANS